METGDGPGGLQVVNNQFSLEWRGDVLHVRPTHFWGGVDAIEYRGAYDAMVRLGCDRIKGWFKCIDLRSLRIDETSSQQLVELQELNAWSKEQGLRGIVLIDKPDLPAALKKQMESGYGGVGVPLIWATSSEEARGAFDKMRRRRVGRGAAGKARSGSVRPSSHQ